MARLWNYVKITVLQYPVDTQTASSLVNDNISVCERTFNIFIDCIFLYTYEVTLLNQRMSRGMRFQTMWWYFRPAKPQISLRIRAVWSEPLQVAWIFSVKLLTKQHLEFLSLTGGCTGSSESTLVKMPHCWKSHVTAQIERHRRGSSSEESNYMYGDNIQHSCRLQGGGVNVFCFFFFGLLGHKLATPYTSMFYECCIRQRDSFLLLIKCLLNCII